MSDETDRKDDDRPQDSGDDHADLLTLEICFLGLVGLVVVAAFIEALGYKLVSSRTPFVIMAPLLILIAVQVLCTAFFMRDVLDDLRGSAERPDDN